MTIEELAKKHGFDKKDNDFSNVTSFARELVEQCAQIAEKSASELEEYSDKATTQLGAVSFATANLYSQSIAGKIRALAGERERK